jgi:hypothetical protein
MAACWAAWVHLKLQDDNLGSDSRPLWCSVADADAHNIGQLKRASRPPPLTIDGNTYTVGQLGRESAGHGIVLGMLIPLIRLEADQKRGRSGVGGYRGSQKPAKHPPPLTQSLVQGVPLS